MKTAAVTCLLLGLCAVAAVWSIHDGWPAEFGRGFLPSSLTLHGDPHNVAGEFVSWRGTAIAPPLALLILGAALAVLAARGTRWAIGLLALAGAVVIAGFWGEPMVRTILWGSAYTAARAALVAAMLAASAVLAVVGYAEWRREPAPEPVGVPT